MKLGQLAASIRPDSEFREEDRSTASWHHIDLGLQDSEQNLSARCSHDNRVTAKINEYARRLRNGHYDQWSAAGDRAFTLSEPGGWSAWPASD
jgi:hypothetical protein